MVFFEIFKNPNFFLKSEIKTKEKNNRTDENKIIFFFVKFLKFVINIIKKLKKILK